MASTCSPTISYGGIPRPVGAFPSFYDSPAFGAYPGMESSKLASILGKSSPLATSTTTGYPSSWADCMPPMANPSYPGVFAGYPTGYGYSTPFSTPCNPWTMDMISGRYGYPTGYPTTFGPYTTSPFGTTMPSWTWQALYNDWAWKNAAVASSRSPFTNNAYTDLCNVSFRPSHPVEVYSLTNPIRVINREGDRMLSLCFDLKGYRADEITVTLNKAERAIIVEAGHDIKQGKEANVTRKYYRKYALPETCSKIDMSKCEVRSCLNEEGLLSIECPLPKMTTEEIAKCPVMSKAIYSPVGYYGCPSTCNVTPINCKIN